MWYLVDAADPDRAIWHVPEERRVHDRSIRRQIRPGPLATLASSIIQRVLESRESNTGSTTIRGVAYEAVALPIKGADGEVLAVQLWAGPQGEKRDPRPPVDAFIWNGQQWNLTSEGTGGVVLPTGPKAVHGAWFLSRIAECEERDRLIMAVLSAEPGTSWEGYMRVLSVDGIRTTRVFGIFRYHYERCMRGLVLPMGDTRQSSVTPIGHRDMTADLLGATTALVDIETMQLIDWLTPPLSNIAWQSHPYSFDTDLLDYSGSHSLQTTPVVHREDLGIFLEMLSDFAGARHESGNVTVRLRTVDNTWMPAEVYATRLPYGPSRFIMGVIKPVSNEHRPISP